MAHGEACARTEIGTIGSRSSPRSDKEEALDSLALLRAGRTLSERFDQRQNCCSDMRIRNSNVSRREIDGIPPRRIVFRGSMLSGLLKEVLDRGPESPCDHLQTAGRDPIGSPLIFLHLLERHTDHPAQFLLAHAPERSKAADAIANMDVDRVGQGGLLSKQSQDRAPGWTGSASLALDPTALGSRTP